MQGLHLGFIKGTFTTWSGILLKYGTKVTGLYRFLCKDCQHLAFTGTEPKLKTIFPNFTTLEDLILTITAAKKCGPKRPISRIETPRAIERSFHVYAHVHWLHVRVQAPSWGLRVNLQVL